LIVILRNVIKNKEEEDSINLICYHDEALTERICDTGEIDSSLKYYRYSRTRQANGKDVRTKEYNVTLVTRLLFKCGAVTPNRFINLIMRNILKENHDSNLQMFLDVA